MKFILKANSTVQEVQSDFKQLFSHLKIEFYKASHRSEEGSSQKEQYLHNIRLADILGHATNIEMDIDPKMLTNDFERMFEENHHLHIQIFRLQRGTWLQTTHSDSLSLESQNRRGIDADIDIEMVKATDVDLD